MRLIFGLMALLIVLAAIGTLGKSQLSALGLSGATKTRAAEQGAETKAVTDAVMGSRSRDAAGTAALPGAGAGLVSTSPPVVEATVPMQAQTIQNNVRDATNAALQKGAERSAGQ